MHVGERTMFKEFGFGGKGGKVKLNINWELHVTRCYTSLCVRYNPVKPEGLIGKDEQKIRLWRWFKIRHVFYPSRNPFGHFPGTVRQKCYIACYARHRVSCKLTYLNDTAWKKMVTRKRVNCHIAPGPFRSMTIGY